MNVKDLEVGKEYKVRAKWERRGKKAVYVGQVKVYVERLDKTLDGYRFVNGKAYIDVTEEQITLLEAI